MLITYGFLIAILILEFLGRRDLKKYKEKEKECELLRKQLEVYKAVYKAKDEIIEKMQESNIKIIERL